MNSAELFNQSTHNLQTKCVLDNIYPIRRRRCSTNTLQQVYSQNFDQVQIYTITIKIYFKWQNRHEGFRD